MLWTWVQVRLFREKCVECFQNRSRTRSHWNLLFYYSFHFDPTEKKKKKLTKNRKQNTRPINTKYKRLTATVNITVIIIIMVTIITVLITISSCTKAENMRCTANHTNKSGMNRQHSNLKKKTKKKQKRKKT